MGPINHDELVSTAAADRAVLEDVRRALRCAVREIEDASGDALVPGESQVRLALRYIETPADASRAARERLRKAELAAGAWKSVADSRDAEIKRLTGALAKARDEAARLQHEIYDLKRALAEREVA